ncbi:sperm microtubule associated protein 2 [Antennarius striatus]|uniref:sperm microtubule associated protein 2 n=1 Tax=Antennarius striatus TaxID=241820 RepID=UPI0035ADD971
MTTRTQELARPKHNRLRHPDRRSVYWLDALPPERTGSTTRTVLTPRWLELCRNKTFYPPVTRSPIWGVSGGALRAVASSRLCHLARPRAPAAGWQPDLPLLAPVKAAAQAAVASSRICQLAQPRRRRPPLEDCGPKPKPGPGATMPRKASAHIELLATPKRDHPSYAAARPDCWPTCRAARSHVASQRLLELSGPKERKGLFEGYDPYVISRGARSANPSTRIQQLCRPLARKCSSS